MESQNQNLESHSHSQEKRQWMHAYSLVFSTLSTAKQSNNHVNEMGQPQLTRSPHINQPKIIPHRHFQRLMQTILPQGSLLRWVWVVSSSQLKLNTTTLWSIFFVPCEYIWHYDLFSRKADWPKLVRINLGGELN